MKSRRIARQRGKNRIEENSDFGEILHKKKSRCKAAAGCSARSIFGALFIVWLFVPCPSDKSRTPRQQGRQKITPRLFNTWNDAGPGRRQDTVAMGLSTILGPLSATNFFSHFGLDAGAPFYS